MPSLEEHQRPRLPGAKQFRPDTTDRLVSIFGPGDPKLRGSDHIATLRRGDARSADEQDKEGREGSREFGEGEPHDDLQKEFRLELDRLSNNAGNRRQTRHPVQSMWQNPPYSLLVEAWHRGNHPFVAASSR